MKLYKFISLALGLAMLPMLAACNDNINDVVSTPLPAPIVTTSNSTYNSVECTWGKVDGAVKYGYEFYDPYGNLIVRDITQSNSASLTDLEPSTNYTFNVWAYGNYKSENGTSETNSFEVRTADLIKLATPEITITKITDTAVKVEWSVVDGAEDYTYRINNPSNKPLSRGTDNINSVTLTGLTTVGTYTVTVTANTTKPGYIEASETATATFEIEEVAGPDVPVAPGAPAK